MCRSYALNELWELFFNKNTVNGKSVTPETSYDIDFKS